jgi:HEAT repeat protein
MHILEFECSWPYVAQMVIDKIRERTALNERYWKRQAFRLSYVLCVIFVLPAVIIGFFVLYLAIYEPAEFRERFHRRPLVAVDPLDNPSFFVRQEALRKLVVGPADRSRRDIAEKVKGLLRDSNFQTQELAIAVLGKWGQPADATALKELAADPFGTFVRPAVCRALGELGGNESLQALIDISAIGATEREHAISSLLLHRAEAEAALLDRAATADSSQLAAICGGLGQLGTEKCLPTLEQYAEDENPQVAGEARRALLAVQQRSR